MNSGLGTKLRARAVNLSFPVSQEAWLEYHASASDRIPRAHEYSTLHPLQAKVEKSKDRDIQPNFKGPEHKMQHDVMRRCRIPGYLWSLKGISVQRKGNFSHIYRSIWFQESLSLSGPTPALSIVAPFPLGFMGRRRAICHDVYGKAGQVRAMNTFCMDEQ